MFDEAMMCRRKMFDDEKSRYCHMAALYDEILLLIISIG